MSLNKPRLFELEFLRGCLREHPYRLSLGVRYDALVRSLRTGVYSLRGVPPASCVLTLCVLGDWMRAEGDAVPRCVKVALAHLRRVSHVWR